MVQRCCMKQSITNIKTNLIVIDGKRDECEATDFNLFYVKTTTAF